MPILEEKLRAIAVLNEFINGTVSSWTFDDWISEKSQYEEIEKIKLVVVSLPEQFPSREKHRYCNDIGISNLVHLMENLQNDVDDQCKK